ncbi:MAG: ABC transporter transmembrane domain-containing protein [Paracoccaceae bacterium]
MDRTLFVFIWKHSKRQQLALLAMTIVTFPFLYATLELPKRIINDAIDADNPMVAVLGYDLTQIQFLMALSFGYLGAVLCHGLLKMRLNTMKGVLAERMLRRFRYQLISRMMRFPKPYFQRTSQGELVSMVTSEAEPMGGLMGDAVAQPVFQAGQMAIIVIFLFMQSVWFGLAGVALIPLQAYIIPILQRQINQLNKKRIIQIRALASEIGETAAGSADLRANGGWRYRRAQFTDRLGRLFDIRFQIYQKKFFMKFLNNFITQLTPFFFYLVGGILAIRGDITVGALVAALAAYKDLSSPWKELLTYYNQVQDMSLRWDIVTERFAPKDIIDDSLFEGEPDTIPNLHGDVVLKNVSVRNDSGNAVLEDISLQIPAGSRVAIKVPGQTERAALADVLTREVLPNRGTVSLAGHELNSLHQSVIAARVGYAQSRPYLFNGTLGTNLMMPLRNSPKTVLWDPGQIDVAEREALRSGNSTDSLKADWTDPSIADFTDDGDILGWWFKLTEAMGIDEFMFRRMMTAPIDPKHHPELAQNIINLRDDVRQALIEAGLDDCIHHFDPDRFNPSVPLGGNLLFAAPARIISQAELVSEGGLLDLILQQELAEQIVAISQTVVDTLDQTFGKDGTDHPLFQDLGIDAETYDALTDIADRRRKDGDGALNTDEFAQLLTVPFFFTAEQIGPAFPESFKEEILAIRQTQGESLRAASGDMFVPIAPENYLPRLSILENLIYGRVSRLAGSKVDLVHDIVADVLNAHGLRQKVAETIWDIQTGTGGNNLPGVFLERAAFSRAAIKRPDILILDQALASHDAQSRSKTREKLRDLMPDATLIFMEDNFENPDAYDIYVEIRNGRIDGLETHDIGDEDGKNDLQRKQRLIAQAELFSNLSQRNQRLLAFSAQWYKAQKDQKIFTVGDAPDAAYLCIKGEAQLLWYEPDGTAVPITTIQPGRVIGDLSVILNEVRQNDLIATQDCIFLRIGTREYLSVVQADPEVAFDLLKTVSTYLTHAAEMLRTSSSRLPTEQEKEGAKPSQQDRQDPTDNQP